MLGFLLNPIYLIIFVLMLGILIFVHELGHFMVAKRLGIPVPEFGFGFPPRAWRFWKSDGWIEIQGRRIVILRDFQLPEKLQPNSRVTYKTQRDDKGREVLTSLNLIDEASQELSPSSPVQAFDRGTEYTLNWIPLGGFVRLAGEDDPTVPGGFQAAKPWVRVPILLAGVTMNFILAYLVFSLASLMSPPYAAVPSIMITATAPNSPAEQAGLLKGDVILAINGQNLNGDFSTLRQMLNENLGRPITLTLIREGRALAPISLVPRANPPPKEGALGVALSTAYRGLRVFAVEPGSAAAGAGIRLGDTVAFIADPRELRTFLDENEFAAYAAAHPGSKVDFYLARDGKLVNQNPQTLEIPATVTRESATLGLRLHVGLLDAPVEGASRIGFIIASVPQMFEQISRVGLPDNSLVGFVGIYQLTAEVAQRGEAIDLLGLLAVLSLNLAIVNLFPFPPLDGGHLVFVFLEWIRGGKRIDLKKQRLISEVGIVLLLGLMLVVTFSDFQRLLAGRSILPPP